jgi:hypothetical protein
MRNHQVLSNGSSTVKRNFLNLTLWELPIAKARRSSGNSNWEQAREAEFRREADEKERIFEHRAPQQDGTIRLICLFQSQILKLPVGGTVG